MSSLITIPGDISDEKQPEKPTARQKFDKWANQLREVHAVKEKARGRGGLGGGGQWWGRLPEPFRVFLLSTITDDDWERYADATWDGLPDGLRSAIATNCRELARAAAGCPWR